MIAASLHDFFRRSGGIISAKMRATGDQTNDWNTPLTAQTTSIIEYDPVIPMIRFRTADPITPVKISFFGLIRSPIMPLNT